MLQDGLEMEIRGECTIQRIAYAFVSCFCLVHLCTSLLSFQYSWSLGGGVFSFLLQPLYFFYM